MTEENQNMGVSAKPRKPPCPFSLPPLSDESDSNAKDYESDSEINLAEGMNGVGFNVTEKPMHDLRAKIMSNMQAEIFEGKLQVTIPE
ncbi:hypothetical protein ACLOJK_014832 [Asimina triloba]